MPLYSIGDKRVELRGAHHYIAHDATLVGAITLEADANIWFKVVIRAENDVVRSQAPTCRLFGAARDPGFPLTLVQRVKPGQGDAAGAPSATASAGHQQRCVNGARSSKVPHAPPLIPNARRSGRFYWSSVPPVRWW